MDTSTRNRVLARAVEVLGIDEMAWHLCITETLVHTYAVGDRPIPDAIWRRTVSYLVERISDLPPAKSSNLL